MRIQDPESDRLMMHRMRDQIKQQLQYSTYDLWGEQGYDPDAYSGGGYD